MTFGSTFGRTFSPTFQPKSQAKVAGGGWWDLNGTLTSCVAAWQAKGAASYAASKVNLANSSTYTLGEIGGGAVNWDSSTGWSGFSTLSRCLDTGITDMTKTWSSIIRFTGVSTNSTVMMGGFDANADASYFAYFTATGWQFYHFCTAVVNVATATGDAVLAIAGADIYVDGSDVGNLALSGTNTLARSPYIGAQHYTSATQFTNGTIQAAAFYNTTLTSTQIGLLTTAMNAL